METQRQKKIGAVLQQDLADILRKVVMDSGIKGLLLSVSKVMVTSDLSIAKVYVSVFPYDRASEMIEGLKSIQVQVRHELAQRTRHQLRRVPELFFFLDDSLEYMDGIEQSLKGSDNPIQQPDLLPKRKKS